MTALAPVRTISATVIDAMLGAGASCDQLAIIARQHFPELAQTVDALIAAGTEALLIGAMLKAHAADCGAAAREAERRKANTDGRRAKRQAAKKRTAATTPHAPDPQYELPMSADIEDIEDIADSTDPLPSSFPPHPPNNYPPHSETLRVSGAVAPTDPKLILFRDGLADLAAMGVTDEKLGRRMLGRWLRDTGGDAARVVSALIEAKAQGTPADPIPYITRLLNKSSEFSNDGRVGRSQDRRPGGLGRLTMHLAARASSGADSG